MKFFISVPYEVGMTESAYPPLIKTSDMPEGFKPSGALLECDSYDNFFEDLEVLVREGFVKITSPETCKWLKSKTSLAEYIKWASGGIKWIEGGFWAPVENAFGIKRHSLRKLAGRNGNYCKPEESRDFMKIKPILQQRHKQEELAQMRRRIFRYIKYLILFEAKDEKQETIDKILEKICEILNANVDKNKQNKR